MKSTIRVNQKRSRRQTAIENQIRRLDNRIADLLAFSRRLSWCRLIIFLIGGAVVFVSFFWVSEKLAGWVAAGAAIGFSVTAWYHYRLGKGIRKFRIWKEIKKSQIVRMTLDWEKIQQSVLQPPLSELPF
ncbi:MAG: hypothetical protein PVF24_10995 [Desulfobacterales bacterium]|jgi:Flp pilus assembly protein TadB